LYDNKEGKEVNSKTYWI